MTPPTATDTFTDADGRRFIAGTEVPEQVWAKFETAYYAPAPDQPTPAQRILRTLVQVVVAVAAAIPAALATVPIPSKYDDDVALVIGIAGALVVVVTAVQNGLEAAGKMKTALTSSTSIVALPGPSSVTVSGDPSGSPL